jgi:cathepsin C
VQPVYYAADYGYVGGFSQGASEEAIMREIYEHGPVAIELAVSAIPMLVSGNSGEVITNHNNALPLHDSVPSKVAGKLSSNVSAAVKKVLGNQTRPIDFKDWLWADHALLSVGWGETPAAGPEIKPGLSDGNHQIIMGTPLQMSLIQRDKPKVIKHWIIRNSWGKMWGDKGYAKLVRGQNAGGVEISAVWIKPDLDRLPDFPDSLPLARSHLQHGSLKRRQGANSSNVGEVTVHEQTDELKHK